MCGMRTTTRIQGYLGWANHYLCSDFPAGQCFPRVVPASSVWSLPEIFWSEVCTHRCFPWALAIQPNHPHLHPSTAMQEMHSTQLSQYTWRDKPGESWTQENVNPATVRLSANRKQHHKALHAQVVNLFLSQLFKAHVLHSVRFDLFFSYRGMFQT